MEASASHSELCIVQFVFVENAMWTLRTAIWEQLYRGLKCAHGPSMSFRGNVGVDALEMLRNTSSEWNEEGYIRRARGTWKQVLWRAAKGKGRSSWLKAVSRHVELVASRQD